ncbi:MAG TPA: PKD domain-containing protein, partial [Chitinophagales bacterium]|nr:PKD domain-containing protein [Chitinophagales bacterium]
TYTAVLTVTTSNGCIAAAQQDVFVHPKPVANFSAPNVCEGKSTQFVNTSSISGGSMNFNWDFGDGNTSALDNPLHTYADTGSFTVALGVVSDQGCTDTVIKTVTVLLQPFADFSIQPACFGSDNVIVDLSTGYEAGAFYQVDIFNDNSYDAGPFPPGNSSINVGSAGSFFAKIRITNLNGCRDSVVEAFTVNSFPVAGFASNDVCFGESITFLNTTTSVDPNLLGALSYQWDFGDGNASIDINPTHAYDTSGIFTVTLIALSSAGCSDTFSNTLIVYPLPVADFTSNVACFNQNVNFTNLSTISFGTMTFLWEFGDNDTSTATNPTHVYTSIGIYQMRLTATSDAGCVTIITRSLIVYPTPAANFIATNVCENEANEFTNLSSIASGTLTYLWDFGDSFNSINEDPEHTYAGDGSYTVTLTATSNVGCTATDTRTVEVYDKPAVSFSANSACFGDTTFFTNNSTLNGGTIVLYNWNFGDGSNSLDVNPWHIYNATGTYKVKLTLTSDKGCVKTDSAAVVVNKIPEVFISHNTPLAFCDGGDVTLTALAFPPPPISSYSYQWSTNETDSFLAVTSTGIYCVSVTDQNGCAADTCELVTVWDLPSVTASSSDDTVSKGYPVQLSATGAQTYQWSADPPDATLNANDQNPIVTPMVTTTYTVAGTDANGCMDTATVTVIVVDDYFVHPANVITPNGDAYNQYWFIENILTYPDNEVLIFDRWGTLVFQAKAYDNTWEGTKDDKALPQGTYYYVIRFDGTDMIYKGSVSIIR